MAEPIFCEARLVKIIASFEGRHADLVEEHPDCSEELSLLSTGLHTIKQLIPISPPVNGYGAVWKELITRAETERAVLCKHIGGKALFTAMLRLYAALHRELRDTALPVWGQTEIDRGISRAEETQAKSLRRRCNETKDRKADA
jgi:hypothetical protein